MFRWGILGTGKINDALVHAVRQSGEGEIAAVASRDLGRAAAYAAARGIPRAHGSYESLIADSGVDIIYNSLPNSLHADWSIRALESGKHVLCEKPFALTAPDADRVFGAARKAGRVAADAFMYRHHPRIRRARSLVEEGAIGDVLLVRSRFAFTLGRPENSRWDPRMGGGSLWDVGCYPVSFSRYIFGVMPENVFGSARWTASGVDESFAGVLYFPGGRASAIDCSFVSEYETCAEVIGTKGELVLKLPFRPDEAGSALWLRQAGGAAVEIPIELGEGRYLLEVREIHAQIRDGRPPVIPPEETRDVIDICASLLYSARSTPTPPK